MAATMIQPRTALTDEILVRCQERAPRFDRENSFFTDDFQ